MCDTNFFFFLVYFSHTYSLKKYIIYQLLHMYSNIFFFLNIIKKKNEQKLILNISTITNNTYIDTTINTNGILLDIYILI